MYSAIRAERFVFHKRAFFGARAGVFRQLAAVCAERFAAVIFSAVQRDHLTHETLFPFAFIVDIHQLILPFSAE